mgnify:CR=1 FL=1
MKTVKQLGYMVPERAEFTHIEHEQYAVHCCQVATVGDFSGDYLGICGDVHRAVLECKAMRLAVVVATTTKDQKTANKALKTLGFLPSRPYKKGTRTGDLIFWQKPVQGANSGLPRLAESCVYDSNRYKYEQGKLTKKQHNQYGYPIFY